MFSVSRTSKSRRPRDQLHGGVVDEHVLELDLAGSRAATCSTVSRQSRDVSRMFALSTEVTRPRRDGEAAISKASRAIRSISSTE